MKSQVLVVALVLFAASTVVYPIVKANQRERGALGLMLSPADVKLSCGLPQTDNGLQLTYLEGTARTTLQFVSEDDKKFFLQQVKSEAVDGTRSNTLNRVSTVSLEDYAVRGFVPRCVAKAAR